MIFTSALFFVLALSFTSASTKQGTTEEELTDQISSVVANKLIQVAKNASTDNTSKAELDAKLLDTIRDILDQEMEPEMEALRYVSNDSADQIAENLALKITKNALTEDGKINVRFFPRILEHLMKNGPPPFMYVPPTWLPHLVALSDASFVKDQEPAFRRTVIL